MFTSLSIRNFRCFEALSLDDSLDRVNLIAGLNSVGKTALLEAIYVLIGMGNAEFVLKLSAFRGVVSDLSGEPGQFRRFFWAPLFHNLNTSRDIEIKATHTEGEHTAWLSIVRASSKQLPLDNGKTLGEGSELDLALLYDDVLKLVHTKLGGPPIESSMFFVAREDRKAAIRVTSLPPDPPFRSYYHATHQSRSLQEDAEKFTRLESKLEPDELVEALRIIEPRLKRVRVGVEAGAPLLRADIGLGDMIPISLLGDGLGRLTGILLSIADAPGGVVLIDEIENGFHHSVLSRVWEAIGRVASNYETQVIATTHSFECIEAAHEAFREDKEYAFRLHRLERIADETHVITYDQKTLAAAIRSNLEVR